MRMHKVINENSVFASLFN